MLLAALAGILIGAGVWALARSLQQPPLVGEAAAPGRSCRRPRALVIGAAGAIINFAADLGGQVK